MTSFKGVFWSGSHFREASTMWRIVGMWGLCRIGLATYCEALGTLPLWGFVMEMEEVQLKLVLHVCDSKEEVNSLIVIYAVEIWKCDLLTNLPTWPTDSPWLVSDPKFMLLIFSWMSGKGGGRGGPYFSDLLNLELYSSSKTFFGILSWHMHYICFSCSFFTWK